MSTRNRQKTAEPVNPLVLALTNYHKFASLLSEVRRRKHPTILPGSAEHQRLMRIQSYCYNTPPPDNTKVRCRICGKSATHFGIRSERDGRFLTEGELFCPAHHLQGPTTKISLYRLTLSAPILLKGRDRSTLQRLVMRAFGIDKRHLTPDTASEFFGEAAAQPSTTPGPWWTKYD